MKVRSRYLAYAATRDIKLAGIIYKPGEIFTTPAASGVIGHNRDFDPPDYAELTGLISVTSYVSLAHAETIAKQAYQFWLKNPDKFGLTAF